MFKIIILILISTKVLMGEHLILPITDSFENVELHDNLNSIKKTVKGTKALKIKDYATAKKMFQEACHKSFQKGCIGLGIMYHSGQGVSKNYAKAKRLFESACNSNECFGCLYLGRMYEKGNGVEKNYQKAKELFAKACYENCDTGCAEHIRLVEEGY